MGRPPLPTREDLPVRPGRGHPHPGHRGDTLGAVYAIATAATGALLVHLRPRNAIGWLLVLDAALQAFSVGSAAYGSYGVDHAEQTWPLAAVVAQVGSLTYLPSIVLPATVLVA